MLYPKIILFVLTAWLGFLSPMAMAQKSEGSKSCREAYDKFQPTEARFSGGSEDVVKACRAELRDERAQLELDAAIQECIAINRGMSFDREADDFAMLRRNTCIVEQAYALFQKQVDEQRRAEERTWVQSRGEGRAAR